MNQNLNSIDQYVCVSLFISTRLKTHDETAKLLNETIWQTPTFDLVAEVCPKLEQLNSLQSTCL